MDNSVLYNTKGLDQKIDQILQKMSNLGFLVNSSVLKSVAEKVNKKIFKVEAQIFQLTHYHFNLQSSRQVAKLLFEDLKLPSGNKTKTGFSTEVKILHKLKTLHPVVPLILEYRSLSKLKSTYLSSLLNYIDQKGRIHSHFFTDIATTGRVVSRDPNLQNIPIRGEWGQEIRKAFIVAQGNILMAVDYSQIDLRVLAHFSQEPKLIEAFTQEQDIHLLTAIELFNKKANEVTEQDRRVAKTVNFGIIYGISPHGLSESLEIDQKQATSFIETYFNQHPQVKKYLSQSRSEAIKNGYTMTLGGNKREIPELESDNHFIRSAGERMAINYPIQGSTAEIIKLAMVEIDQELETKKLKSKMILQIHDELLFEVSKTEREILRNIVKEKMENAVKLRVPLVVSMKEGKNWGEMKEIRLKTKD